jgi:hypothetical protein
MKTNMNPDNMSYWYHPETGAVAATRSRKHEDALVNDGCVPIEKTEYQDVVSRADVTVTIPRGELR